MKKDLLLLSSCFLFISCANSNYSMINSEIPEDEHITVCGEINGEQQTYPTLKDLKNDGAKFLHYDPCYN